MFKAVFFDWFNTLAHFDPPREVLYSQALAQFGIELSPQETIRGISMADQHYFAENAKSPVRQRSPQEQLEVYAHYPKAILAEAGIKVAQEVPMKIVQAVVQQYKEIRFALYDDVLPTLKTLKKQRLTLALLTNLDQDMKPVCQKLGLGPYIDFTVTSAEAGADKPAPAIFQAALRQAGVKAAEAVHVGDQYQIDVIGARGVGISPILIDRYDLYPGFNDCPRINCLAELAEYL